MLMAVPDPSGNAEVSSRGNHGNALQGCRFKSVIETRDLLTLPGALRLAPVCRQNRDMVGSGVLHRVDVAGRRVRRPIDSKTRLWRQRSYRFNTHHDLGVGGTFFLITASIDGYGGHIRRGQVQRLEVFGKIARGNAALQFEDADRLPSAPETGRQRAVAGRTG